MDTKKVCILLSLYNSKLYLNDLLFSISQQKGVDIFIFARDDGSTDGSIKLFEELCHRHQIKYEIYYDNLRIGSAMSFFKLLENAPPIFDFYAFCDHDDYWLPNKVLRAIEMLHDLDNIPSLYASTLAIADEQLNIIRLSSPPKKITMAIAILENHITGCTAVINKIGRESFIQKLPTQCIMHDWWTFLYFSAFGKVVFDSATSIIYRQHPLNLVGMPKFKRSLCQRYQAHFNRPNLHPQVSQAKLFFNLYIDRFNADQMKLLKLYIQSNSNLFSRLKIFLNFNFKKSNFIDSFLWRILVLFNRH